jgi:hypothetical protein
MSLVIDTIDVMQVLLMDGWHEVSAGTFNVDAYEFVEGSREVKGVPPTGFTFVDAESNFRISGPLNALLAVKSAHGPAQ